MKRGKRLVSLILSLLVMSGYGGVGVFNAAAESNQEVLTDYIQKVACGNMYSAVLKGDGSVWTWGTNNYGQLGLGNTDNYAQPQKVLGLPVIRDISAGKSHCIVLDSSGQVWAWGNNTYGQLGDNTKVKKSSPVQVQTSTGALSGIVAISAGDEHNLAVDENHQVWAWGNNTNGRLGNGAQTASPIAIPISIDDEIVSVAAGGKHSLAVTVNGNVYAWGYNAYGQLGIDSTTSSKVPVLVSGIENVKQVSGGASHSGAVTNDGFFYGWGRNDSAQLAIGNFDTRIKIPTKILSGVNAVITCENVTLFIDTSGYVAGAGYDFYGQLGNSATYQQVEEPEETRGQFKLANISNIKQLDVGTRHVLAIDKENRIWGWGDNSNHQLDTEYGEKMGLPRELATAWNDFEGDSIQTATPIQEESLVQGKLNTANDIDVFKVVPSQTGTMYLSTSATKPYTLEVYTEDNQLIESTDISGAHEENMVSFDVNENNNYYLTISGEQINNYQLKNQVVPEDEILRLTDIKNIGEYVEVTGVATQKNVGIQLLIYDNENQPVAYHTVNADDNGNYKFQVSQTTFAPNKTYQLSIGGIGTRNSIQVTYPVTQGRSSAKSQKTKYANSKEQVIAKTNVLCSDFTVKRACQRAKKEDEIIEKYTYFSNTYNLTLLNNGDTNANIGIKFIYTDPNGNIQKASFSKTEIAPGISSDHKMAIRESEIIQNGSLYAIVTDLKSDVPIDTKKIDVVHLPEETTETRLAHSKLSAAIERDEEIEYFISEIGKYINSDKFSSTSGYNESVLNMGESSSKSMQPQKMDSPLFRQVAQNEGTMQKLSENTSPNMFARMTLSYSSDECGNEWELRPEDEFLIESTTTNYDSAEHPVTLIVSKQVYDPEYDWYFIYDIQLIESTVLPESDEILTYADIISQEQYDESDALYVFTWDSLRGMHPLGMANKYYKEMIKDNCDESYDLRLAPLLIPGIPFRARINHLEDQDIFAVKPDATGDMIIETEPTVGEGVHIAVFNSSGKQITLPDVTEIPVRGDEIYYILVFGEDGMEYSITVQ